ncbi:sensor histidine kinase [uncultured Eubacterium sp.]|uniref:sensor histidine kinase n=1 Tax=uncultured Eubacterium sp. TaxID=165185 RepID=UPI002803D4CB|nr:sensor histidine kinase [uncultured Eubacterium sp.]
MFKHSKTKLSVLIIAIVIFGVIFSTLASTLFFSVSYKNSMFSSAYVTSKQSVAQADETVSNYFFSIKSKLDNLCVETDKCNDAASLQKVISTAARLEDDIYCVSVYDMQGNVLSNGNNTDENIKDGLTDLSFDKSVYSNLKDGYAISQPHVNTLYQNKYPWVVTIAKKEYSNLFSQQVFVAIDFKFSSIAKYIDKVSIGQRGYCYIVNSKGQIIYHPQQQMLFSGLKEENTFEISELSDGIHRKKDNIYNISSLDSCNWKIVGVSFNDEITQAVKSQVAVGLIFALLFSAFMSAVIYFLLSRTVTRPVRRLVASMQKFEKQAETFEYKADMSNVAEFQTLSTSFEHMVLMIQSLVEKVHNEEIVLRKTELKALQAQINPHFLYNTLDSIQWMCEQDNSKDAVKMVGALAKLFRISISHGNEFIAISDELKHAESYLIIQSYRYKNQFTYSFDVDKSVLDCMCNKITIQPFIENAIYHGLDRMVDEGEIKIIVERRGKDIAIIVKDNGLGMTEEQCKAVLQKGRSDSKGIGVKNVDDRLKIYFGEEYGITIDSELDVGTTVTIKIPKIEKGHENEY